MFWASLFQNTCQVVKCWVFQKQNEHFAKFTGKYLCKRLFFNKVAGLRLATLLKKRLWHRYFPGLQLYLKKRLWHRCFPVNFVKVLRTSFLQNTSGQLLPDPANIFWSPRRLEDMFSVAISCLPRHTIPLIPKSFEDVLRTSWRDLEDVLEEKKLSWLRNTFL